jgi:hypothetical protein
MNNFYVGTSLIFMIDILLELEPESCLKKKDYRPAQTRLICVASIYGCSGSMLATCHETGAPC